MDSELQKRANPRLRLNALMVVVKTSVLVFWVACSAVWTSRCQRFGDLTFHQTGICNVRFRVLTEESMKIRAFCDDYTALHPRRYLRYLQVHTALQPRRPTWTNPRFFHSTESLTARCTILLATGITTANNNCYRNTCTGLMTAQYNL
jgi:hypothetical protein